MLADFFQLGAIPTSAMTGEYDIRLVILSYLVASFASFIALDITGRLRDIGNTPLVSTLWLIGGSVAMGAGIWSMHFIGMLAFSMPHMSMAYDPIWTAISMLVAIGASAFALFLLKPKVINVMHTVMGGIILGIAIASMHYTGMYAMKISMNIHYLPGLFTLSIVIAIIASEVALWLALKSNQVVASMRFRLKLVSAIIMGAAICGMHYTGMAAAIFTPLTIEPAAVSALDPHVLAIGIAMVTFIILSIAVFASTFKEAKNQQQLATARQAGMAEVAASVLHNVGNVLNSVNVSASMIEEKITGSKLEGLTQLSKLLEENKSNLGSYITHDPVGSDLPKYITLLASQWKKEQTDLKNEAESLIRNINHIRTIINMQQNLSKVTAMEQITSIASTIDEALFITGVTENHKEILVRKEYSNLGHILVDKVKLLQILVNLINNAKDSLKATNGKSKSLHIKLYNHKNDKIKIEITDNGAGINPVNLSNIFAYGFTTKKEGHGFGLHTSALDAKDMGGMIIAKSDGPNKGATFILELPYKLPHR